MPIHLPDDSKPYVIGGCALFVGYVWAMLRRVDRSMTRDLVKFQQRDQMKRLRRFFSTRVRR